jgi:hypothetical protein
LNKLIRATAGSVALEVRAQGYLPVTRNVFVTAGNLSRETVKLTLESMPAKSVAIDTNAPPQPAAVASTGDGQPSPYHRTADWRGPVEWVVGVGAVALAAGGVVALVIKGGKNDQLQRRTDTTKTCTRAGTNFSGPDAAVCVDLAQARDAWNGIAIGTFVGAGVAALATIILVATRPARQPGTEAAKVGSAPHFAAAIDQQTALVLARWQF